MSRPAGCCSRPTCSRTCKGFDPAVPIVPRRRRVRLAGAPARLPGRHHAERPDESPTGRSCRTPTGRRCRSAARQGRSGARHGRGRRARAAGPAAVGLAAVGVELVCCTPSGTCWARRPAGPGTRWRPWAPSWPTPVGSRAYRQRLRALEVAPGAPRGGQGAAAALVVEPAGRRGGLLRCAVGSVPLGGRRGRGRLAGRTDRGRVRQCGRGDGRGTPG